MYFSHFHWIWEALVYLTKGPGNSEGGSQPSHQIPAKCWGSGHLYLEDVIVRLSGPVLEGKEAYRFFAEGFGGFQETPHLPLGGLGFLRCGPFMSLEF